MSDSIDLDDEPHFHYYPTDGSIRLCEKSAPCFRSDMHYWVLPAVGPMAQRLREDLAIAAQVRADRDKPWPQVIDSDDESEPSAGGELLVDWKAINERSSRGR